MAESALRIKSYEFAKNIVLLCRQLKAQHVEAALVGQLLRCGTSVGANVHEAQYAQSTKDFISKYEIALKECNESEYWLNLIHDTDCMSDADHTAMTADCLEIRRMLVASIKTLKNKL